MIGDPARIAALPVRMQPGLDDVERRQRDLLDKDESSLSGRYPFMAGVLQEIALATAEAHAVDCKTRGRSCRTCEQLKIAMAVILGDEQLAAADRANAKRLLGGQS